jgi:hypothetical protein
LSRVNKNHYNPCFWIAYWNSTYLNKSRCGNSQGLVAREQQVYVLNVKKNEILIQKTKKVFFQKKAGLAVITREGALDFCLRMYPSEYKDLKKYYDENKDTVILDFENHFTEIERLCRNELKSVIHTASIDNINSKTFISFFVYTQIFRNHNTLKNIENIYSNNGMPKFEVFMDFKNIISSPELLMATLSPFVNSEWIIYKSKEHLFPISDSCVLLNNENLLVPLSPDLLLRINYHNLISAEAQSCITKNIISDSLISEFTDRTIQNSNREIVFSDSSLLKKWQSNPIYQKKMKHFNNF